MKYLLLILLLTSCVKERLVPECSEIKVEQVGDQYLVWWLPELDPTHMKLLLTVDGEPIGMCRRDSTLRLHLKGKYSFYAQYGQEVCVDRDYEVTADDCECITIVK